MWCTTSSWSMMGATRVTSRPSSSVALIEYLAYVVSALGTAKLGYVASKPEAVGSSTYSSHRVAETRSCPATPGCVMNSSNCGVWPDDHSQSGSPSSTPLLKPSPSESWLQSVVVHDLPADLKSLPNWFWLPPPPEFTCPTPFTRLPFSSRTLYPFGMRPRYDPKAAASCATRSSATSTSATV